MFLLATRICIVRESIESINCSYVVLVSSKIYARADSRYLCCAESGASLLPY